MCTVHLHTATSSANSQKLQSSKGKGKGKGGTPKRPKVATVTLKVVPVDPSTRCTPMASYRNKHLRLVHLEKCCDDIKALDTIRSELQVPPSKTIRYLYTRGRSLRPATLEDVPGVTSWEPVKPGLWTLDWTVDWTLDCNMDWSLNLYELAQCGQVAEIAIKEALGTDLEVEIHSEQPNITTMWLNRFQALASKQK